MSAAANAAGYLYAHGKLPVSDLEAQVDVASPHHTAKSPSLRRVEPKTVPYQDQSQPLKQARAPRIEYRKRRCYLLPTAA